MVTAKSAIKSSKHQVNGSFRLILYTMPLVFLKLFNLIHTDLRIGALSRWLTSASSFAKFFSYCWYSRSLPRHAVNCSNKINVEVPFICFSTALHDLLFKIFSHALRTATYQGYQGWYALAGKAEQNMIQ
jgi:hypothetical protein